MIYYRDYPRRSEKKYYRRQTQKTQKTKQKEKNYEHLLDSEQVIECNFSLL